MQFPDTTTYEFATAWAFLAAAAGFAVFGFVLRLLDVDRSITVKPDVRRGVAHIRRVFEIARQCLVLARRGFARLPVPARPFLAWATTARAADVEPDWQSLAVFLQTRADRMQAIGLLHERASDCIEAAEYALDRLLADCAAVMLTDGGSARLQHLRGEIAGPLPARSLASTTLASTSAAGTEPLPDTLAAA